MSIRHSSLPALAGVAALLVGLAACESKSDSAASSTAAAASAAASAAAPDANLAYARGLTKRYGKRLKNTLAMAIGDGSTADAVKACNIKAPKIAEKVEVAAGWKVGRTSLKLRNVANAPDAWETKTLERLEAMKKKGTASSQLEHHEVVDEGGVKTFRYMRAIQTVELCLRCHGGEIEAEVKTALEQAYPKDQAFGHATGDLRGAFTLQKKL